ncbi:MAG TPA: RimK family alpha-L-glutamate ligase [Lachnospiraceae bacterium]|nr:RimK family alpha-L-glutamate ligase [Lachnospiraceae bacterium]
MKKGLLITNAFLTGSGGGYGLPGDITGGKSRTASADYSAKFNDLYEWLVKAAEIYGICLMPHSNAEFLPVYGPEGVKVLCGSKNSIQPDFVLFWDKDVRLARAFEAMGIPVFNSACAIELCDDKSLTLERLSGISYYPEGKEGCGEPCPLRIPVTIMAPMTFKGRGYKELYFIDTAEKLLSYPMVIKECFGSFGAQVYLARNRAEAEGIVSGLEYPFFFQEFIGDRSFCGDDALKGTGPGRDIRLQVVGDRVAASMLRSNNNDFRANITNGGSMEAYKPTQAETELAVTVCKRLGLDFAGVDILFGTEGPVLCEVNSNAHFKNLYECTGINIAEHIMRYIKDTIFPS